MIEIPSTNAQDAFGAFVSSIFALFKMKKCRWQWVLEKRPPPLSVRTLPEIDGMLPSLAPLLVECAGKREPLCEVAG